MFNADISRFSFDHFTDRSEHTVDDAWWNNRVCIQEEDREAEPFWEGHICDCPRCNPEEVAAARAKYNQEQWEEVQSDLN